MKEEKNTCYTSIKEPNDLQCKLKHFRIHSDIIQNKEDLFRELLLFFSPPSGQ